MKTQVFESIVDQMARVVRQHGERVAVSMDEEKTLTYNELWRQSGLLAHSLQRRGVSAESVVAISLPKSISFVVAVVGVWRAGAAHVPVDRCLPATRREFLIRDSGARFVIGDDECCAQNLAETLAFEDLIDDDSCELKLHKIHANQLAYVIYTSGTTGQPKGVQVMHRGLCSMLRQQIDVLELNEQSRSLFLLSTSFDASVSDIGTALLSGACLHIESRLFRGSRLSATPRELVAVIRQRRITYVDMPPAMLATIKPADCPDCLDTILIGGEVCHKDVVRRWARRVRLVNVYGPTEATVCTSLSVCDPETWDRPLIGEPLKGVHYDIDGGEDEGELLIGGDCLARGYLNRKEQEKPAFIEHRGQRYYRTGDRVRRDLDGCWVFLGRMDRQVKIRGHRVEPGEIESLLTAHPLVRRCAVVKRSPAEDSPETLVAVVLLDSQSDDGAGSRQPRGSYIKPREKLQAYLGESLPVWMLPSRIEFVDSIPETANGKIDYQTLATRRFDLESDQNQEDVSDREQTLLAIFSRVLGRRPEVTDGFLTAGGDSLSAMQVSAVAEAMGLHVPPVLLIEDGCVRSICQNLDLDPEVKNFVSKSSIELCRDVVSVLERQEPSLTDVPLATGGDILLTGATGFLGVHVLANLLNRYPRRSIYCIVRGSDPEDSRRRLARRLHAMKVPISKEDWRRVIVVPGDIAEPLLGVGPEHYGNLARRVTDVVHCAAAVDVLSPYEDLRQTNVIGTAEIARFVSAHVRKRLYFASTLSVFVGTDLVGTPESPTTFFETDDLGSECNVFGGYAQSKWAAEKMLRIWSRSTDAVTHFRFGLLTANTTTGTSPANDMLSMAMRGVVELGCVPAGDASLRIDITPVDYAARAMVQLMDSEIKADTFHIAHPVGASAAELIESLCRVYPTIEQVDAELFLTRIAENEQSGRLAASACLGFAYRLEAGKGRNHVMPATRTTDLFLATGARFDMQRTLKGLEGSGIHSPQLDSSFLDKMIRQITLPQEGSEKSNRHVTGACS